jgi:hypothetical protein
VSGYPIVFISLLLLRLFIWADWPRCRRDHRCRVRTPPTAGEEHRHTDETTGAVCELHRRLVKSTGIPTTTQMPAAAVVVVELHRKSANPTTQMPAAAAVVVELHRKSANLGSFALQAG